MNHVIRNFQILHHGGADGGAKKAVFEESEPRRRSSEAYAGLLFAQKGFVDLIATGNASRDLSERPELRSFSEASAGDAMSSKGLKTCWVWCARLLLAIGWLGTAISLFASCPDAASSTAAK